MFRHQLDLAAKYLESYETLATSAGIHPEELDAIRFTRPPTIFRIRGNRARRKPRRRRNARPGNKAHFHPTNPPGGADISVDQGPIKRFSMGAAIKMGELIDALLKRFEADPHRCFTQPDDTMINSILQDDIAIVREQNTITIPDCYLFQSGPRQFIARAVPTDNSMMLSYDNPNYNRVGDLRYNPQKHLCLGRRRREIDRYEAYAVDSKRNFHARSGKKPRSVRHSTNGKKTTRSSPPTRTKPRFRSYFPGTKSS